MAVIAISRQFGAGGRELGKQIAHKLEYYYADEDILEKAAVEVHVSPEWEKIVEMESGGKLQRYISKLNPFGQSLMERPLTDKQRYIDGFKYVELMHSIITRIAEEGNAVIVGRGGQYILQDFEDAYHLLLIANEKDRVKFIVDKYNFSHKRAVQVVKTMEKRRVNLYSFFGRKDYDDLSLYNLTLNMSKLSMDQAKGLVHELIKKEQL